MSDAATTGRDAQTGGGHWLTRERLTVYPRIVLAVLVLSAVGWLALSRDLVDPAGKPVGYDFITFWAASQLTLSGEPAAAFDLARIFEAERRAVSGLGHIYAWHYPPTFQLLTAPLALMPYLVAFLAWVLATLAACIAVVRRLAPAPETLFLFLAFPATWLNFAHGQTGFLTAALFGGALLLLERRPLAAGVLIGLLSVKPHFGLLLPLALLCGRRWTAFASAAVTTLLLVSASAALLGGEVWFAFFGNMPVVRGYLEGGAVPWVKMTSPFVAARLGGLGIGPAYALQGVIAVGVAACVAWAWWRNVPPHLAAALLAAGSLLVTPYVFDYDLVLLAVPLALIAREGLRHGWLAGEREVLVIAWLTPLLAPVIAHATGFQPGPLALLALFAVALRRAVRAGRCRFHASG